MSTEASVLSTLPSAQQWSVKVVARALGTLPDLSTFPDNGEHYLVDPDTGACLTLTQMIHWTHHCDTCLHNSKRCTIPTLWWSGAYTSRDPLRADNVKCNAVPPKQQRVQVSATYLGGWCVHHDPDYEMAGDNPHIGG